MIENTIKSILRIGLREVFMMPTANLNLNSTNSCNNWTCCPWRRKQPRSPVSEIVDTNERIHAVYHKNAPPQIQVIHTEMRSPMPEEKMQRRNSK